MNTEAHGRFLLKMKNKIGEAKTKKAELEGKVSAQKERLKKDFGCSSIKEAEKELAEMNKLIEEKTTEFQKGVEKLNKFFFENEE